MQTAQTPASSDADIAPNEFSHPSHVDRAPRSFFSAFLNKVLTKSNVPSTVWLLGSVMCMINISFVMIYSLSALYAHTSLGVSAFWIGLLEGTVEAVSFLMKLVSGMISDYFRRRKTIMVIGYFLTVISKPILAISSSFGFVFASRFMERLGNGIQATPRDAMVSDVAPANHRGASFGLMRTLGTAGSFLGGILGFTAMVYTSGDFNKVFWIATIPAFFSFLILTFFVREPKTHVATDGSIVKLRSDRRPIKMSDIAKLDRHFWLLLVVVFVFYLARFSETLMSLHANIDFGLNPIFAPLIMSTYNITYSLSSYPAGRLADRMGRRLVLAGGIFALVVSTFFLSTSDSITQTFVGIFIWGIQMGVVHNTFVSLITDYVPEDLRGTSLGLYYLVSALGSFIAGPGGGALAQHAGYQMTFFVSMCIGIVALIITMIVLPSKKLEAA